MFRFKTLLRYLLVLAFCFDGSATLWKASAMAAGTAQHAQAGDHEAGDIQHDGSTATASAPDCPDAGVPEQGDGGHEGCDCADAGCSCACDFLKVAVAHKVPPAGTAWLAYVPVLPGPAAVGKSSLSSLFRPPIG